MFRRWMRVAERCSRCGVRLAPRPGDTWGFWILFDRLFVIIPVLMIYLGIKPPSAAWHAAALAAIIVPLVVTMPHRMGVCVGLDFLTREREDDLPPRADGGSA